MQKIFAVTLLVILTAVFAGCGYTPEQRGVSGAALGGATGAAIGAATGGGALGAATGVIVGANPPPPGYYGPPPPPARCARIGYDAYGNQVCTAYYGY
jgi:hypothetical protein